MTDYLTPVPVSQPVHFAWTFSVAPYEVKFKWAMPSAQTVVPETISTWTNGVQGGGPPTVYSDTTTTFHVDLVPTSGPGPALWRVEATDSDGSSLAADEGIVNVAGSQLKS